MKAILVIDEMPVSCDKCEVRCGGYTAKEYAEKSIKRPSWCPLKPMNYKIGALGSVINHEGYTISNADELLRDIIGETE